MSIFSNINKIRSHMLPLSPLHTPKGQPDPLNSAFRLTYNMALNLLRVEEINPEYMLERSFFLFQNNSSIPSLEKSGLITKNYV